MHNDILIINSTILPLSQNEPELIQNGFISIRDGAISGLGPMADLPESSLAEKTINASGHLLMPGLVTLKMAKAHKLRAIDRQPSATKTAWAAREC